MLQLKYLRENKEAVLKALEKRNFKEVELIDNLLDLDESRRKTQTELVIVVAYCPKYYPNLIFKNRFY